ncbi:hypothetical protein BJ956_001984 [Arthrobacter psychrochitiniphilus]|nr:hypothetical protein [Arthrobacter psychrochitiniphilus]
MDRVITYIICIASGQEALADGLFHSGFPYGPVPTIRTALSFVGR